MMHGCKQRQARPKLGLWQLTHTKQESRPEIQVVRQEDRATQANTIFSIQLPFSKMLILCNILILTSRPSRSFPNTMVIERNSIGIDLLKHRATHDQLTEWDVEHLLSWGAKHTLERTEETIDEGFKVARKNCHGSITGHLGEGDS